MYVCSTAQTNGVDSHLYSPDGWRPKRLFSSDRKLTAFWAGSSMNSKLRRMRRSFVLVGTLIFLALHLCSCALFTQPNPAPQIAKFAQATTQVTSQTQTVYQAVQNEYTQAQLDRIVSEYNSNGFNPSLIKPFFTAEQLQVRMAVLQGLSAYAQGLAAIASDDQLTAFDSQTKALGQELISLDKTKPVAKTGIDPKEMAIFATAVDTIGRLLVEYKREKGLKEVIQQHDGDIRKICDLFVKEIGGSSPTGDIPPSGLRNQLWNEYTEAMTSYDLFIEKSRRRMGATEEFNAISHLADMVGQQISADAMLASTAKALQELADTHSKLSQSLDHPDSGIEAMFTQLQSDTKAASDFYSNLQSNQK
jgi:hypothetical protein